MLDLIEFCCIGPCIGDRAPGSAFCAAHREEGERLLRDEVAQHCGHYWRWSYLNDAAEVHTGYRLKCRYCGIAKAWLCGLTSRQIEQWCEDHNAGQRRHFCAALAASQQVAIGVLFGGSVGASLGTALAAALACPARENGAPHWIPEGRDDCAYCLDGVAQPASIPGPAAVWPAEDYPDGFCDVPGCSRPRGCIYHCCQNPCCIKTVTSLRCLPSVRTIGHCARHTPAPASIPGHGPLVISTHGAPTGVDPAHMASALQGERYSHWWWLPLGVCSSYPTGLLAASLGPLPR